MFNTYNYWSILISAYLYSHESMSSYLPQTEPQGDIGHLSKIDRKPKGIGTELKNVADVRSNIMLGQEIQRGKLAMSKFKYVDKFGPSAGCACRLAEMGKDCFKKKRCAVPKTKLFLDAGFGNLRTYQALRDADIEAVMAIKHGKGGMPKQEILNLTKEWPCGASLVLRCTTGIPIGQNGEVRHPIFVFYKSGKSSSVLQFFHNIPYLVTNSYVVYFVRLISILRWTRDEA